MKIKFFKMHGLGNDYIYINNLNSQYLCDFSQLSQLLSRHHFSIGSDGIVVLEKSQTAVVKMRIFNADGTEAELCGNALRCVAKYCFDTKLSPTKKFAIETFKGLKNVEILSSNGLISQTKVEIGTFEIMKKENKHSIQNFPISYCGKVYYINGINLDNPHAVIFCEQFPENIESVGSYISNHPIFPNKTNVEFVQVQSPNKLKMKVFERGSGITLACGSGACASAAASTLFNFSNKTKPIEVEMDFGNLSIEINNKNELYLSGEATYVCNGEIDCPIKNCEKLCEKSK